MFSASLEESDEILRRAQNCQAIFMIRLTAGKLWEGWQLIGKYFFSSPLARDYEDLFSEEVKINLKEIKHYFSKSNLVKIIRDEYAFHYSSESTMKIENLIKALNDKDELVMYFNEHSGNCFYDMADTLLSHALLQSIQASDINDAMRKMLTEIVTITHHFLHYVGECVLVFGKRHLSFESHMIDIPDPPFFDEVHIPYFVSEPKNRKEKPA